jgi:hypothetical protein
MHYNFIDTAIDDNFMAQSNIVLTGEIYGKQTSSKFVMYNVLKVSKTKGQREEILTLQNIDNPLSLFETTAQKLASSGYVRISQTPYIDLNAATAKKRKAAKKPTRCPLTFDFLEARADSERPVAALPDLFTH